MNVASFLGFAVFAGIIFTSFRRSVDPFAPWRVFGLVWSAAIGLAALNFSGYQASWSTESWLVLLLGLSAFLLGLYFPVILNFNMRFLPIVGVRKRLARYPLKENTLFWVTVSLFILYAFSFVIETAIEGTVPILSPRPDVARVEFGVFGLHLLVASMPIILFLAVEYLVLTNGRSRRKAFLILIFFLTAASFFLILQRFAFVVWALITLGFLYYTGRFWRWRTILLGGGVFLGLLAYIQSLRLVRYVANYIYVVSKMRYSVDYAIFTEPYMYVVMNLENFARGVEKLDFSTYGYYSFDFLMAITGLKHWLADYFNLVERPFLISGYNTFPFLWPYYYDFGIVGVAIMSFVLAFAIGLIYVRLRSNPTLLGAALYANAFCLIALSFFTNLLTSLSSVFNIVVIVVVHWYVSSDSRRTVSMDKD